MKAWARPNPACPSTRARPLAPLASLPAQPADRAARRFSHQLGLTMQCAATAAVAGSSAAVHRTGGASLRSQAAPRAQQHRASRQMSGVQATAAPPEPKLQRPDK